MTDETTTTDEAPGDSEPTEGGAPPLPLPVPTPGRIVFFSHKRDTQLGVKEPAGQSNIVPAVIVSCGGATDRHVNLRTFPDGFAGMGWETSVPYRDDADEGDAYWAWPPHVYAQAQRELEIEGADLPPAT